MSPWWLVVCAAIFLIGLTKSGFGAGVGLMNVPLMFIATDHIPSLTSHAALGLMLPLLIVGDLIVVWQYRDQFDLTIVKRLIPGTLVGVVLGGLLLWTFEKQRKDIAAALINLEIGFESVLLVSLHWYRTWRRDYEGVFRPNRLRSFAVGSFAGVSSTIAHGAGPIISLHLLPQKLDRRLFVITCSLYFAMLNILKLPAFTLSHQFDVKNNAPVTFSLLFTPLVLVGAVAGYWLNKRMNDAIFSKIVYLATFLLGWYLLIDWGIKLAAIWKGQA